MKVLSENKHPKTESFRKHKNYGFTLIELLVVVAIIAMLSSVIFASIRTARDKANVAKVAAELRQLDIAFRMLYDKYGCWPAEGGANSCFNITTSNPTVASLVASSTFGLKEFLKQAPTWPYSSVDVWKYDNDMDSGETSCIADTEGIQIYVNNVSPDVYKKFEMLIDGTTEANVFTSNACYCGKIQFDGCLSNTTNDMDFQISKNPNE